MTVSKVRGPKELAILGPLLNAQWNQLDDELKTILVMQHDAALHIGGIIGMTTLAAGFAAEIPDRGRAHAMYAKSALRSLEGDTEGAADLAATGDFMDHSADLAAQKARQKTEGDFADIQRESGQAFAIEAKVARQMRAQSGLRGLGNAAVEGGRAALQKITGRDSKGARKIEL